MLIVSVNQVQDIGGGTPAEFKIPVEIGVRDSQGVRTQRLQLTQRRQIFEVPAPEAPSFVRFDEHGWIPKRLDERKSTDEWTAIAQGDDDVNGRRDAVRVMGRVLAKGPTGAEKDKLRGVLLERLAKDTCAVVRAEAATSVAGIREADVRAALAQAAGSDPEARVRSSALSALRTWGADPELAALALHEYQVGFSWDTMGSAAGLYATAHPNGAFEWIAEQLALETPGDALRVRLLPLLAGLHDPRALALAQRFALDAQGGAAGRSTAAKEIGSLGRGNPAARATLERLLGSPVCRVRREAIGALSALGDPTALDALRALHDRSTLAPELLAIENAIRTLQGDG
jgi:HEAT repeats